MTMEPNMLKDIVLPPSMIRKLLNAAGVSGLQSTNTAPLTAAIPWRSPGIRHANNEIFFDIEESLDALLDRWVLRRIRVELTVAGEGMFWLQTSGAQSTATLGYQAAQIFK